MRLIFLSFVNTNISQAANSRKTVRIPLIDLVNAMLLGIRFKRTTDRPIAVLVLATYKCLQQYTI